MTELTEEQFKTRLLAVSLRMAAACAVPGLDSIDAALDEQDAVFAEWMPCPECAAGEHDNDEEEN